MESVNKLFPSLRSPFPYNYCFEINGNHIVLMGNLDGSTIFIPAILFFLFNLLLLWGWFGDGKGWKLSYPGMLDGNWLEVPSLFQMYKNCSLFNILFIVRVV